MIRDLCVFARQDLTRDPPFSRLDLVLCRNVLIYMDTVLQKKLLSVFHYALNPNGFLVLGQAETVGAQATLFSLVDKKFRIHRRKATSTLPLMTFPVDYSSVQEALNNVFKHAHATRVSVLIERRRGSLVLVVEDNGCGFESEGGSAQARRGLGLVGMRERAGLIGALLEIESAPGGGTTVFLTVPGVTFA